MNEGPDVVAFGEVIWDLAAREPVRGGPRLFEAHPGGATSNFAIVAARLGLGVAVVAGVGDDPLGEELRAALASEGIDVRGLARTAARTGVTFVTRDRDGEPRYSNYRVRTADLALRPRDVPAWPRGARWLVVGSTHAMLPEMARATLHAARAAKKAGAHVAVDLNARRFGFSSAKARRVALAPLLAQASLVKASAPDLVALGFASPEAGRRWLKKAAPHATVLVTQGAAGAAAHGGHGDATSRGARVASVDAAGAGDAFLAGIVATLLAGGAEPGHAAWASPEIWTAALEVGHSLGSKVVSQVGGTTGARNLVDVHRRLAQIARTAHPRSKTAKTTKRGRTVGRRDA